MRFSLQIPVYYQGRLVLPYVQVESPGILVVSRIPYSLAVVTSLVGN